MGSAIPNNAVSPFSNLGNRSKINRSTATRNQMRAYFNSRRLLRTRFPIYRSAMITTTATTSCNLGVIVASYLPMAAINTARDTFII